MSQVPYSTNEALETCKRLIEQQLGWGDSTQWTSKDFEELSLLIQEKTKQTISEVTLKRIWGYVTYNSRPSLTSLTTLAAFLGHPSWRAFKVTVESPSINRALSLSKHAIRPFPRNALYLFSGISLLAFLVWLGVIGATSPVVHEEVKFLSRAVTSDIPNTVVFDYDLSGIIADSFFIQQSWDPLRRASISAQSQTHTSIYYRPGFFIAKLIADTSVIKEIPIHVTTEGWLPLIEIDPIPINLKDAIQQSDGYLSVATEKLQKYGYSSSITDAISFYNVRNFGTLHSDYFSLETTVRHETNDGRFPCRRIQVVVIAEQGALSFLLGVPGCVSELGLMFGDLILNGSSNDLSAFGVDVSMWQQIYFEVKERDVLIQIGSNTPYATSFTQNLGKVVGLRISFEGNGSINSVLMKDREANIVYEEVF